MTLTPILFDLGKVFATPSVLAALEASGEDPHFYLGRHATGEWSRFSQATDNLLALVTGGPIVSSHATSRGVKFVIATSADRSETYLFLPEDYTPEERS